MSHDVAKEGLIHKSYHVLFIIYAPIALISIFLKFFSDKYSNYVFMFALLASAVSVLVAFAMWVLFWKHRELIAQERKAKLPYLIRHQFILMYLPIAFLSMGLSAYFVYDKYVKTVEEYELTELRTISVLLPLKTTMGRGLVDTYQIKQGIGSFLVNNPDFDDQYHLDIVDHSNHYSAEFEQTVLDRMRKGTRYFLCAYSDVCGTLGKEMERLTVESGLAQAPIIVTTLASSMTLPLARDTFYRFFVRNQEDAHALAKKAFDLGMNKVDIIAAEDAYGEDAIEQFTQASADFGIEINVVLRLDPALTDEIASEKINESPIINSTADAVFVALYQPANAALSKLAKNKALLLSANYQQESVQRLVESGAPPDKLIVSLPEYKAYSEKMNSTVGLFMYTALEKLFQTDRMVTEENDFHSLWIRSDYPPFLDFELDSENDLKISMKAELYADSPFSHDPKSSTTNQP